MTSDDPNLESIRRDIDKIDRELYDALKRRMDLISSVSQAKRKAGSQGSMMRPAREATVLRSLLDGHSGPPQAAVLARLWREMINAATFMQGPLSVAVSAPAKSVGYWDLARNHFGSSTPMSLHRSPMVVVRRVISEAGAVGVVPLPQEDEEEAWWLALATAAPGEVTPKIIWRLPFYTSPSGAYEEFGAMAIGCIEPEDSGQDVTVLALDTDLDLSRARLLECLKNNGTEGRILTAHEDQQLDRQLLLVEVDGFLRNDDARLGELAQRLGESLRRIKILGAYPVPVRA